MQSQLPFYPEQASNFAPQVDALMLFITAICVFFAAAITAVIVIFFFKFHRKQPNAVGIAFHGDSRLEAAWIIVPLILAMAMFGWGAVVYVDYRHTPQDTLDVYVIAKQWMWKAQQPNGIKEINELHVPVGRNVRLVLASEDVIHDFFVPAFRVKMDVVPGHYNTMWFRPTKPGRYHFFCSQYCGTNHALMAGWVTVMPILSLRAKNSLRKRLASLVMSLMGRDVLPPSTACMARKFSLRMAPPSPPTMPISANPFFSQTQKL